MFMEQSGVVFFSTPYRGKLLTQSLVRQCVQHSDIKRHRDRAAEKAPLRNLDRSVGRYSKTLKLTTRKPVVIRRKRKKSSAGRMPRSGDSTRAGSGRFCCLDRI